MAETAEQEAPDEPAHQQPADHAAPARTLWRGRGLHRRSRPGCRRTRGHLAWRGSGRRRIAPAPPTAARAPSARSGKRVRCPEERDEHHHDEHGHSSCTSHGNLLLAPTGGIDLSITTPSHLIIAYRRRPLEFATLSRPAPV